MIDEWLYVCRVKILMGKGKILRHIKRLTGVLNLIVLLILVNRLGFQCDTMPNIKLE